MSYRPIFTILIAAARVLFVSVGTTLAYSDITGNAGTQNRICGICGMKPGFLIRAIGIRSEGIKGAGIRPVVKVRITGH